MHAAFLQQIDWMRPWLSHVRAVGQAIAQSPDWRSELNRHIALLDVRNHRGKPVHFVPQAALPAGMAYEQFISETGGVPTRDNLHDFFNALVWLHFPRIKVQLNVLQVREIERIASLTESPSSMPRGKVRDAATIFDENAVLLVISDQSMVDALRTHQWQTLFVEQREAFLAKCQICLFGHALMEKLVAPYKAITGHAWIIAAGLDIKTTESWSEIGKDEAMAELQIARLDAQVTGQLMSSVNTADFSPLPVLGVPGWWAGQDAAFYEDRAVFRPMRTR